MTGGDVVLIVLLGILVVASVALFVSLRSLT